MVTRNGAHEWVGARHIPDQCPECIRLSAGEGYVKDRLPGLVLDGVVIVEERAKIRGSWDEQSRVSQNLKMTVRAAPSKFPTMSHVTKEAVDQILEKLARALTGDQWEAETWVDIQGYCELVLRSKEVVR
jgi:hypothetical protein